MDWQFVVQVGNEDKFSPPKEDGREQLIVQLHRDAGDNLIQQDLIEIEKRFQLTPSAIAKDFLNISLAIYSADKMIDRGEAYDDWTRYITLYIPVFNKYIWEQQRELLLDSVRFLSGDYWEIEFRDIESTNETEPTQAELFNTKKHEHFVLLSGGLDSFIGAIDILESTTDDVVFISHHGMGGHLKPVQDQVIAYLEEKYKDRVVSIQPFVQPPISQELSQRSRSLLFLGLGIFIASGFGQQVNLYVCENGFISLNVPISPKRIGSNSTRTTHPYFIENIKKLLNNLELDVEIKTPYGLKTKGEMLKEVRNNEVLQKGLHLTRSCSKSDLRWKQYDTKGHCGVCMPCIVRRAALRKAGLSEGVYLFDVTSGKLKLSKSRGETLRAIKIYLERYKEREGTLIFELLSNGSIPERSGSFEDFESVFQRGLIELIELLG